MLACDGGDARPSAPSLEACGMQQTRCGDGPMVVFSKLNLVKPDSSGRVAGFDVDGLTSAGDGPDDCHVADGLSPEGTPGIDNRFSDLLANTTDQIEATVPAFVQNGIKTGGLVLLGEFVGLDDPQNDDDVGLVIRRSEDIPLLGTDQELLDGQTFQLAFDHYVGAVAHGKVVDGRFTAGPTDLRMRMRVFDVRVSAHLRDVYADFRLDERGAVVGGILGGTFHTDDIYGIADAMEAFDPNESTIPIIRALIPPLADVKSADTGKCDRISFALSTAALRAFVFDTNLTEGRYAKTSGPALFTNYGCIDCHAVRSVPGADKTVGPSLDGFGARAKRHDRPGNFARQAVINPDGAVAAGYEPGIMPKGTREKLTNQEFDTLIEWLLSL